MLKEEKMGDEFQKFSDEDDEFFEDVDSLGLDD